MADKEKPGNRALGKGLGSLLGSDMIGSPIPSTSSKTSLGTGEMRGRASSRIAGDIQKMTDGIAKLQIDQIIPNPQQPRKIFKEDELKELSDSIKVDGILQPVVVTMDKSNPGKYLLVAGERRLRASKMAGLSHVPALVKEMASVDMLRLALIENIQRSDLNVIEEARAYEALIQEYGLTQEACSQKVGKERSTVANCLRMLTLPKEVQEDIVEKRLSMGHGRALLSLEKKALILRARDLVIAKKLSVRQTEQACKSLKESINKKPGASDSKEKDPNIEYIADALRTHLRTKVKVAGNGHRGKIEISYFSPNELERVYNILGGGQ